MKYLPLIWSGTWRKRGRTILIFLQVAVAFTLFGVLQGLKTGVDHAIAASRADLLLVYSRLSFGMPLPIGMLEQIRSVPGVAWGRRGSLVLHRGGLSPPAPCRSPGAQVLDLPQPRLALEASRSAPASAEEYLTALNLH